MVIVTGAFLTQDAKNVDGKLHVWEGMVNSFLVEPHGDPNQRSVNVTLVALTRIEQPGDNKLTMAVEVVPPTGAAQTSFNVIDQAAQLTGENGFEIVPFGMPIPVGGRYVILLTAAGSTVSVPVTVHIIPTTP
jgi:hypothetical protein